MSLVLTVAGDGPAPIVPPLRAIPADGDPAGTVVPAVCAERKKP
jgi:hypothetical protein